MAEHDRARELLTEAESQLGPMLGAERPSSMGDSLLNEADIAAMAEPGSPCEHLLDVAAIEADLDRVLGRV